MEEGQIKTNRVRKQTVMNEPEIGARYYLGRKLPQGNLGVSL
jgi:hypothetical protein